MGATNVRQGTMLGEYIGEVIGESKRKRREMLHGFSVLAYTMNYSSDTCIDAKRRGGIMRYASLPSVRFAIHDCYALAG